MMKFAGTKEEFELEQFEKLSCLLESDEVFSVLKQLHRFSDAELLRQLVGKDADTTELLHAAESSKYPLAVATIKLISDLRKVTRRIQMMRKLRGVMDE